MHRSEQELDDYVARLVDAEIAHARAVTLAEDRRLAPDPMSRHIPLIMIAFTALTTVAVGASLLVAIFA